MFCRLKDIAEILSGGIAKTRTLSCQFPGKCWHSCANASGLQGQPQDRETERHLEDDLTKGNILKWQNGLLDLPWIFRRVSQDHMHSEKQTAD